MHHQLLYLWRLVCIRELNITDCNKMYYESLKLLSLILQFLSLLLMISGILQCLNILIEVTHICCSNIANCLDLFLHLCRSNFEIKVSTFLEE